MAVAAAPFRSRTMTWFSGTPEGGVRLAGIADPVHQKPLPGIRAICASFRSGPAQGETEYACGSWARRDGKERRKKRKKKKEKRWPEHVNTTSGVQTGALRILVQVRALRPRIRPGVRRRSAAVDETVSAYRQTVFFRKDPAARGPGVSARGGYPIDRADWTRVPNSPAITRRRFATMHPRPPTVKHLTRTQSMSTHE